MNICKLIYNCFLKPELEEEICELKIEWKIINKLLESNEDLMCSISYENIELNDEYCRCLTCSTIYNADELIIWFKNDHIIKTCPMCNTFWPKSLYQILS